MDNTPITLPPRERSRSKELKKPKRASRWSDGPSKFTTNPSNQISISTNIINQRSNFTPAPSQAQAQNVFNINDSSKIKKKIYIPKQSGINYVGLLIGPKGTYQKCLEQQSGCKILVRGKGTQKEGMPPQPDDHEEQHVLIVADSEENIKKGTGLVERILYADEETRTKIKNEQIKASKEIRTELLLKDGSLNAIGTLDSKNRPVIEKYLMTPYGPPDKNARILPVPDDCVGLIIGKNGDTIRKLNRESGCKIQIAIEKVPNSSTRNVFIEGPNDKYEIAKKLIEAIICEQINMKQNNAHLGENNPSPGPYTPLKIPNKMVGLIIGRNGETVKTIHSVTKCNIFIPKDSRPGEDFRELQLSGPPECIELCKKEIMSMIHLALYGRLPYMNSLFYPFIDPITKLPIIDPGIMAQLDPNAKNDNNNNANANGVDNVNDNECNVDKVNEGDVNVITHKDNDEEVIQINEHVEENEKEESNKCNNNSNTNANINVNVNNTCTNKQLDDIANRMFTFQNNFTQIPIQHISNQINQAMMENVVNNMMVMGNLGTIHQRPAMLNINQPNTTTNNNNNNDITNSNNNNQSQFIPQKELQYDLENYYNPLNYDLYFQSVYQMYPQLSDYYKKVGAQSDITTSSENKENPVLLVNTTLIDRDQTGKNDLDECQTAQLMNEKDDPDKKNYRKDKRHKK